MCTRPGSFIVGGGREGAANFCWQKKLENRVVSLKCALIYIEFPTWENFLRKQDALTRHSFTVNVNRWELINTHD